MELRTACMWKKYAQKTDVQMPHPWTVKITSYLMETACHYSPFSPEAIYLALPYFCNTVTLLAKAVWLLKPTYIYICASRKNFINKAPETNFCNNNCTFRKMINCNLKLFKLQNSVENICIKLLYMWCIDKQSSKYGFLQQMPPVIARVYY